MNDPKDKQAFTDRDAAALTRLHNQPPPSKLMDRVMTGIAKESPQKRALAPELPRRCPPPPSKGREKSR